MPKVTMQEISKLAGVSPATVSRALHSPHLVRKATRERITRVMQTSDYVYNATAADLSRQRSTMIGVIIPTTRSLVFSTSLLAIQEAAQENSYSIMAGSSKYDPATESALISQFQERRPAGVILTGFLKGQQTLIRRLVRDGMPCIVIWDKLDDPDLSYVGFDNFEATHAITEYLIGLRHRRIGLIIGPYSKVDRVRRRLEGFLGHHEEPRGPASTGVDHREGADPDRRPGGHDPADVPARATDGGARGQRHPGGRGHGGRAGHGAAHPAGRVHRQDVRAASTSPPSAPPADHRQGPGLQRWAGWRSRWSWTWPGPATSIRSATAWTRASSSGNPAAS